MRLPSVPARAVAAAFLAFTIAVALPAPGFAWGGAGHAQTARLAVEALPEPLRSLYAHNQEWFTRESSFADRWRFRDKAESARHFLDTERFGVGTDVSKIPADFSKALEIKPFPEMQKDGLLPWTVGERYELLVNAFRAGRWDDVMRQSVFLSHYIADAHVPFHATENYDGQLSDPPQKGVHARFESQMVERFVKPETLRVGPPAKIEDPTSAALGWLRESIAAVPVILAADRLATASASAIAKDTESDKYWSVFTRRALPIARERLEAGGRDLAGVLLAAWNAAGRPTPPENYRATEAILPFAPAFPEKGEKLTPEQLLPPPIADVEATAARAGVQTRQVMSALLQREVAVNILLPKNYTQNSDQRYPVIYLLHGAFGAHDNWNARTAIAARVKDLPLIVVMPDARNSFYVNAPQQEKYQDFFLNELVPWVDQEFRTHAEKDGRATIGLSMGGYGAWRIALLAPDKFCAAASLSGALFWGMGPILPGLVQQLAEPLYGGGPKANTAYQKDALLPLLARHKTDDHYTGPALYFDIGTEDMLLDSNRLIETELLRRKIPAEYHEFSGQHDWTYWNDHVQDAIEFVRRYLTLPKTSGGTQ